VEQHELRPPRGAKHARKRVGRGNASQGTYAGKGTKGQQARAGSGPRPGFEGGQTPLIRRLPRRRGFHNPFRVAFTPVNLRDLAKFPANSEVTPETLREAGIIRSLSKPIKVLSLGELSAPLTVKIARVSAAARAKIEAAGGSAEETMARKTPEQKRKRKGAIAARAKAEQAAQQKQKQEEPAGESPADEKKKQDDSGSESSESTDAE
jgi:large subunit ribosomal protein L15